MPGIAFLKTRPALLIALCMLAGAAVSWARVGVAGTIGLDDRQLALVHQIWPFLLFGGFAALAGHFYLKAVRGKERRHSHLLHDAENVVIVAIAGHLPAAQPDIPLEREVDAARAQHAAARVDTELAAPRARRVGRARR